MSPVLIILFSVVAIARGAIKLPPDLQKYADTLHDVCVEQTGITEADHAGYDIINHPHDEKLQCYMKCLFMEAMWMDKDGVIQYEWIEENVHEAVKDIVIRALKECRNIEGEKFRQNLFD